MSNINVIHATWKAPKHITAFTTLCIGGFSKDDYTGLNMGYHVGDNTQHVMQNRYLLHEYISNNSSNFYNGKYIAWLNQTHSSNCINLDELYILNIEHNKTIQADAS